MDLLLSLRILGSEIIDEFELKFREYGIVKLKNVEEIKKNNLNCKLKV